MSARAERAADLAYAAGWRAVRALPESAARRLFDLGADLAARRLPPEAPLRRNLGRVLGTSPEAVPAEVLDASMRSYARYWREAFRLPALDPDAAAAALDRTLEGREHLDAAMAGGRGLIIALPHAANWDLAGLWLARRYGGFATVAERLRPERLYQRFLDYRRGLGFTVFPLTGGPRPPMEELADVLGQGGIVCMLGERDLRSTGVPVDFFGSGTRMPAGPALLAQRTGADLVYGELWYSGPAEMRIRVHPPIDTTGDVTAVTQRLADEMAAGIARHPADWHMLQPLWTADLPAERRRALEDG